MTMFLPFPRGILPMVRRAVGVRRRRADRGASAVEFALVSPLLFTLLFGAIDYGLYFSDALTVQQSVADAARDATLSVGPAAANWQGSGSCPVLTLPPLSAGGTNDLAKVVCQLSDTVQPIGGGVLAVKAEVVDSDGAPTPTWKSGNRLRVCAVTRHTAVMPFVPMPGGGILTTKVEMPIQPGGPPTLALNPIAQDPSPNGADWSWC
jgi:hypothetical protein